MESVFVLKVTQEKIPKVYAFQIVQVDRSGSMGNATVQEEISL